MPPRQLQSPPSLDASSSLERMASQEAKQGAAAAASSGGAASRPPVSPAANGTCRTTSSSTIPPPPPRPHQIEPTEANMVRKRNESSKPVAVENWGYPGYLTREEWNIFQQFMHEVNNRPPAFKSTIYSFSSASEDPTYALCRWLRARKFNLQETVEMVEQATKCRASAGCSNFFPDGHLALGVEPSVYHTQYPQFYYSFAKGGHPLFISRVGMLNAEGLSCVTTMRGILNYHWHDMMHSYTAQLEKQRTINPTTFKRYEVVCVIDLEGLTTSHLTKRALDIVKAQTEVDSLCFPETLRHLVIINAPGFFAVTWKLIRNWIDARTANKVTILNNNRTKWIGKLKELVDVDQLPVDYGGTGLSIDRYLENKTIEQYTEVHTKQHQQQQEQQQRSPLNVLSDDSQRSFCPKTLAKGQIVGQKAFHFSVRNAASHYATVLQDESMELSVFTRSVQGGKLRITSPQGSALATIPIRHKTKGVEDEEPTRIDLDAVLDKPGRYKFKIESNAGLFGTEDFVLVTRVFGKDSDDHHLKIAASKSNLDGSIELRGSESSVEEGLGNFVDVSLCHRDLCRDANRQRAGSVVHTPLQLEPPELANTYNSILEYRQLSDKAERNDDVTVQQRAHTNNHRPKITFSDTEKRQPSETVEVFDGEDGGSPTGLGFCGAFGSGESLCAFFDLLCGGGSANALARPTGPKPLASPRPRSATAPTPSVNTSRDDDNDGSGAITTMASF